MGDSAAWPQWGQVRVWLRCSALSSKKSRSCMAAPRLRALHNWRARCAAEAVWGASAMAKAKKNTFSRVKAVKANARERVGMPPPEIALPSPKEKAARRTKKHKETLGELLQEG